MVIFVIIFSACHLVIDLTSIILAAKNSKYITSVSDFYNADFDDMKIFIYTMMSICGVISITVILFGSNLLFFHLWLNKYRLSTYDYTLYLRSILENPDLKLDSDNIRSNYKSKVVIKLNDKETKEVTIQDPDIETKEIISKHNGKLKKYNCCDLLYIYL